MPYRITSTPPLNGAHSLGPEVLEFDDTGTSFTDSPDVIAIAAQFPTTFAIEEVEEVAPVRAPAAHAPRPGVPEVAHAAPAVPQSPRRPPAEADPSLDPDAILRETPPTEAPRPPEPPDRRGRR